MMMSHQNERIGAAETELRRWLARQKGERALAVALPAVCALACLSVITDRVAPASWALRHAALDFAGALVAAGAWTAAWRTWRRPRTGSILSLAARPESGALGVLCRALDVEDPSVRRAVGDAVKRLFAELPEERWREVDRAGLASLYRQVGSADPALANLAMAVAVCLRDVGALAPVRTLARWQRPGDDTRVAQMCAEALALLSEEARRQEQAHTLVRRP